MKLGQLPRILPGIHEPVSAHLSEVEVAGVAHDSRRIKPGWVFVAIPGHSRDGADFATDAVGRGAVAVVAQRRIALPEGVPLFVVQNARRALAALANSFHGRPSRRIRVIGVTGTNGKTTTTYMIRSILEAAGRSVGLMGTICYDTGRRVLPASITTPESVDVQKFLAEMVAQGRDDAVLEVSSHALCMHRVDFVQFAAAVFTNLSPEHMDYHRTMAAYREAKAKLFRSLGPASFAVLNADDRNSAAMARATCAKVVRYGLRATSDVTAKVHANTLDYIEMSVIAAAGSERIRLPMIGLHNVSNALAAAAAALTLGCDLGAVRRGLENVPPVPGRLETVPCGKDCRVLIDYAHTDQALRSVLRSLRKVAAKRIIVVFGAGGDRDRSKRPRMGRVVEEYADVAWVTSDNPRSEDPGEIIDEILSGVRRKRRMRVQPDRRAAIAEALEEACSGDVVLIAGKGHERTQKFRDKVIPFDDREAVREAVGAGSAGPAVVMNS